MAETEQPHMMTAAQRKKRVREKRKQRTPIESTAKRLDAKAPPGFVGRYFNDAGSRIDAAKAAGWEFMVDATGELTQNNDDPGTLIRIRVDKNLTGEPLYAYFMVIEEELYAEDQKRKLDDLIDTEKELERGESQKLEGKIDGEKTYVKDASLADQPM